MLKAKHKSSFNKCYKVFHAKKSHSFIKVTCFTRIFELRFFLMDSDSDREIFIWNGNFIIFSNDFFSQKNQFLATVLKTVLKLL